MKSKQIDWVCNDCGSKYGKWYQPGGTAPKVHYATYHLNTCDVCGATDVKVAEPRDYGYLCAKWRTELKKVLKN